MIRIRKNQEIQTPFKHLNIIAHLQQKPEDIGAIFISFSETQENAEICKMFIDDERRQTLLFRYMRENHNRISETFKNLFEYEERRKQCVEIFTSKGGIKLLKELSKDQIGKMMITTLCLIPHGIQHGFGMLNHKPTAVFAVAFEYLRS